MTQQADLIGRVASFLVEAGLTVAVAESCTGGLLGAALTDLSGSSAYFLGGVLSYSDALKVKLLGVDEGIIRRHGAVSAECALEMARGVRILTAADVAISVTGVAGPTGGTEAKPVGTTYIGLSASGEDRVMQFLWAGDREANRLASVGAALGMLIDYLEETRMAREPTTVY
ncbi:MAG: CinA family protein [Chloroflexota bacterium]|nr:CinA family protein [Chloroflexota bacterium]